MENNLIILLNDIPTKGHQIYLVLINAGKSGLLYWHLEGLMSDSALGRSWEKKPVAEPQQLNFWNPGKRDRQGTMCPSSCRFLRALQSAPHPTPPCSKCLTESFRETKPWILEIRGGDERKLSISAIESNKGVCCGPGHLGRSGAGGCGRVSDRVCIK